MEHWSSRAACVGSDDHTADDPTAQRRAMVVCAGCPVRRPCAAAGRSEHAGVWAGRLAGAPLNPERRPTDLDPAEVRRLYLDGASIADLAERLGVSYSTIQRRVAPVARPRGTHSASARSASTFR